MAGEQVRTDMLEAVAYNLGAIADALRDVATVMRLSQQLERERFERQYPEKKEGRDATVTHRQTEEERLRESQGATPESDEEWIGRRETQVRATEGKTRP